LRARFEPVDWQPDEQTVPHVPPRTDLERNIAKVWADVLGVTNPGIHDNFFDSGGDSLATVTLLTGLSEVAGIERLTAGVLVEAPTIAELAMFLSRTGNGTHSSILPLQPAGGGAPLFWIGGFPAPSVVNALDRDRPVFLLSILNSPNRDAIHIIDQYAEECFQTLRRFRPKGPYLLAGFCVASVIVIELARRLREEGDDVGLILFDARCVLRHNTGLTRSLWISSVRLTQNLLYHFEKLLEVGASNIAAYIAVRMRTVLGRVRRSLLGSDLPAVLGNSELLLSIALRHYQPKPYTGRIVHIWAADRPKGQFRDLTYEWGSVGKGPTELYEVPGNHISMFQGENGKTLGRILNHCLNDIEPDARLNSALT
jgi:thioesterase domain-containing protein